MVRKVIKVNVSVNYDLMINHDIKTIILNLYTNSDYSNL